MKLPQIQNKSVASMGRANLSAVGAKASAIGQAAQGEQRIFNQVAALAKDFIVRKENSEFNTQKTSMHTELMQFEERHLSKQFYTADEASDVPDTMATKNVSTTDAKGVVVSRVNDSIPAYEVYPQLLENKMKGMIKEKAAKITNPYLREQFIQESEIIAANKNLRAGVTAADAQRKYLFDSGVQAATEQAAAGDLVSALFTIDNIEASELVKAKMVTEAKTLDEVYDVTQAIRSSDQEAVELMKRYLTDPDYEGNLSEPQRQAAISDLNARDTILSAERDAEIKNAHAMTVNGLSVGIVDGQVTRMDLDAAQSLWSDDDKNPSGITPPEHTALVKQLAASQRGSKDVADYEGIVAGWLSGEMPADPSNNDHKKAMDWYVAEMGLTPQNERAMGILARNTGIIPEALQVKVNGYVLNGSPEQAATGLKFFDNLQKEAPHLVSQFSEDTKKVSRLASQFRDGGMDTQPSIDLAREYLKEVTPDKEKFYNTQLRLLDRDSVSDLEGLMDDDPLFDGGWFSEDTGAHPEMVFQFEQLTQRHYALTKGNYGQATQLAYQGLQEQWGTTEVGLSRSGVSGKRAMRWPPERYLDSTSESVQLALDDYASDQGIDSKSIILVGDRDTAKNKTWNVILFDEEAGTYSVNKKPFEGSKWLRSALDKDWDRQVEIEKYKIRAKEIVKGQNETMWAEGG